jgi:DNA-binding transcriptional ArsR family regulator
MIALDHVFHALADPTRRAVLQRLSRGPASVKELAEPFEMALPSFLQHLKVLESGGLIRSRKVGRVRTCEIEPAPLTGAEAWIAEQRSIWEGRLDRLEAYVTMLQVKDETNGKEA